MEAKLKSKKKPLNCYGVYLMLQLASDRDFLEDFIIKWI